MLSKIRPKEGTAIIADFQTQGKGQVDSQWQSNPGENILMSIVFYPEFLKVNQQYLITCFVSLSLRNVLSRFLGDKEVRIKWPNDILCEDRKIAGILIHNTLKGKKLRSSVIGIGININQKSFSETIPNATSLSKEYRWSYDLEEIREMLFRELDERYKDLKKNGEMIRQKYLQYLYGKGIKKQFKKANGTTFEGSIAGIDKQGFLMIEGPNNVEKFDIKEVIYL